MSTPKLTVKMLNKTANEFEEQTEIIPGYYTLFMKPPLGTPAYSNPHTAFAGAWAPSALKKSPKPKKKKK